MITVATSLKLNTEAMAMQKQCVECGKLFEAKRSDATFCRPACRYAAWAKVHRPNAVDVFKAVLKRTGKFGKKGEIIEVWINGEMISRSISPEFEACRVLKDRGMSGYVQFWREGKETSDLGMSIEWGSTHYVTEGTSAGLSVRKWEPNPLFAKDSDGKFDAELADEDA